METKYGFRHEYCERELVATCVDHRLWGRHDFLSVCEQIKSEDGSQKLVSLYLSVGRTFQKAILRPDLEEVCGHLVLTGHESSDDEVNRDLDELRSKKLLQKVSRSPIYL